MLPEISTQTLHTSICLNFSNQVLVENNILVPDTKPNIKKVVRINSAVTDIFAKASDGEAVIEGSLTETMLYIGDNARLPFYSLKETADFKETVILPDITPAMKIFVLPKVEFTEYNVLNDRKVNVKNVVSMEIYAFSENAHEAVISADDPNLQTLEGAITYSNPADIIKETINISESFDIPDKKPDIAEILTYDAYICEKDVRAMNEKIQIQGTLCMEILYTDDYTENSIPEILNVTLPFSGFADVPLSDENMQAIGTLYPKNIYLRAVENEEGENRRIEADVSIGADLLLMENTAGNLIYDAYSLTVPVVAQRESVAYSEIIPTVITTFNVSDSVTLDESLPSIVQVLKVWSYVSLDDSIIEEDKVVAEGDVRLEVLYVGEEDAQPLHIFNASLPFRQEVEINNASPGQIAYVTSTTENTSFDVLNDREIQFSVSPLLEITLVQEEIKDFLTGITEVTGENLAAPGLSSAVIYIVQPGDTLWEIAKKFGTTTQDLAKLNSLENPDIIYPGDRILIMRTVLFQ